MAIDVSVVVPFFNPGANLDACLASLTDQTLAADRFEAILVDDGSTDGSHVRVEEWGARHPGPFTLRRLAASGGPARPRNVGHRDGRGRYIQFLDSDDTLTPQALERQLALADASDADVVVGKLSSDFRGIWHPLFRETVTGKTLATYPLIQNLTVCKMFRQRLPETSTTCGSLKVRTTSRTRRSVSRRMRTRDRSPSSPTPSATSTDGGESVAATSATRRLNRRRTSASSPRSST